MLHRSIAMAGLLFLLLLGPWVSPGWTQSDLRFEQHSPEVEKYWKNKILRNPRDGRAYFHLGRHYEFTRRIQLAAEAYRQATLLDPGWPQAFFYLGKAYRELGRYQEAAVAMKRAVTLKSDYARAHHFLGLIMINLGRYEEAADALVKAYTYNPGWAETYYDNTTYGIHHELGTDKEVNLRLIKYIYPVNQHLARILYNNWSRGNAAMKEYWETVSGSELPADKGYQQGPIPGYREPQELGYQKAPALGGSTDPADRGTGAGVLGDEDHPTGTMVTWGSNPKGVRLFLGKGADFRKRYRNRRISLYRLIS